MNKHPMEFLSDAQLEDLLKYTDNPFKEENQKAIQAKFHAKQIQAKQKQQRKRRLVSIASVAAVVLMMVGWTYRDDLRVLYLKHFGSESEVLLLNSERLASEVEDRGLRLKAVASFKDGDQQYLLSELTDLTGDRLSQDMQIDRWHMLSGGNTQVINYDEKTKTATLLTRAIGANQQMAKAFQLEAFAAKELAYQETYPVDWQNLLAKEKTWVDLSSQNASGGGVDEKALKALKMDWETLASRGLKPMEVGLKLDNYFTLSNIAYKDQLLHLQLKIPNNEKEAGIFPKLVLADGTSLDTIADVQVDQGTHKNSTGQPDYLEAIFNVKEAQLVGAKLVIEGWRWQEYQKGNWAIKLPEVKSLPKRTLANQSLTTKNGQLKISQVEVSPISLRFNYQGDLSELPISLHYKNDAKVDQGDNFVILTENEPKGKSFRLEFAIHELSELEAITIDGQELKF